MDGNKVLTEDDFCEVYSELWTIKANYHQLGIELGLPPGELQTIQLSNSQNIDQAFVEVLLTWLRQQYNTERHGRPTWQRLVEAVGSPSGGNNSLLAERLTNTHLNSSTSGSSSHHFGHSVSAMSQSAVVQLHNTPQHMAAGFQMFGFPSTSAAGYTTHSTGSLPPQFVHNQPSFWPTSVEFPMMAPPSKKFKHAPSAQAPIGQIPLFADTMQQFDIWRKKLADSYLAEESKSDAWPPLKIVNFIQLALVQQEKRALHLHLHTIMNDIDEIYAQKINVTYDDLFQNLDHSSLLLIEGRPGSGKTTLLVRILCDWAKGKMLKSKLILFVRLRYLDKTKEIYLHELLRVACCALSPEDISGLSSYIEGRLGEDVVFVLDSFDEYGVAANEDNFICNLISGKVFSRSTVILSSRPAATQGFRQIATQWIEVVGFMKEQVMQYIHAYFEHDEEKGVQLEQHLSEYTNVLNLCYLPVYCAMLVYLYEQESFLPETETEFYRYFTLCSIFRTICKGTRYVDRLISFDQLLPNEKSILDKICYLAFKATIESRQVFKTSEISDIYGDVGSMDDRENLGLLVIDRYFVKYGCDSTYSFFHLSLQEYLSALYIASCNDSEQLTIVTFHTNKGHLYVVWRFLFGILNYSKESTKKLFKLILDATCDDYLLHIQCAYESHHSAACTDVLRFHKNNLMFKSIGAFSLACITYVLKTAEYTAIKLNFESCNFSISNAKALLNGIGDRQLSLTVHRGEAVQSVLDALSLITVPGLIQLDLSGGTGGGESVNVKNNLKYSANLQKLVFVYIGITNLGLEEGFKHWPNLKELGIGGTSCPLTVLEAIKHCTNLMKLTLYDCNLDVSKARVLGESLKCTSKLHTIVLNGTEFVDEGLQALSDSIKNCEELKELNLYGNNLTDKSVPCLTELIKSARNLENLDLHHNRFSPEGKEQIEEVMRERISVGASSQGEQISSVQPQIAIGNEFKDHTIVVEYKSLSSDEVIDLSPVEADIHLNDTPRAGQIIVDSGISADGSLIHIKNSYLCCVKLMDYDLHNVMQETHQSRNEIQPVHQTTYFSIAEMTAHVPFLDHQMLECDCNGREYTNVDHDITLRIPEGAVAEGKKVHFEVAVTMYGPFNFPENTKLISPILWLCLLEEAAELKRPLEIVLPHYLTGNIDQYNIGFMKANHNDYEMNDGCQMFYNFRPLISDSVLVYRKNQGYAVTVTDHLCYLCLAEKESATNDTNYCLARVESCSSESLQEIIFCASYLLPTCIKAIKQQYPGSTIQFSRPFKFKEPQGSLKIIVEPSDYSDKCLIATEPSDAEIEASEIDFTSLSHKQVILMHNIKTYPPRVKMSIYKIVSSAFIIPVKVDGCLVDGKLNTELLFRPEGLSPHSPNSASLSDTNSQASFNSIKPWTTQSHLVRYLTEDNHSALLEQLQDYSVKWKEIGSYLGFRPSELDVIEASPTLLVGAPRSWLNAMLARWLQWAPGDSRRSTSFATLDALKAALNQAELGVVAHNLKSN